MFSDNVAPLGGVTNTSLLREPVPASLRSGYFSGKLGFSSLPIKVLGLQPETFHSLKNRPGHCLSLSKNILISDGEIILVFLWYPMLLFIPDIEIHSILQGYLSHQFPFSLI